MARVPDGNQLSFHFEWEDGAGVSTPELAATWARLSITAGGQLVTRVLDKPARSLREAVYVPLYPIARWLVENWWSLHFEPSSRRRIASLDFRRRHDLRFARDGFALPSIEFLSDGRFVEVNWCPPPASTTNVEFLSRGSARVDTQSFEATLRAFVSAVVTRLRDRGSGGTDLEEDWEAIDSLTAEERLFATAVGVLGGDPFALEEGCAEEIAELLAEEAPEGLSDLLACTEAENLEEVLHWLRDERARLAESRSRLERLGEVGARIPHRRAAGTGAPSDTGYHFARSLRQELGIEDSPLPTTEAVVAALSGEKGQSGASLPTLARTRADILGIAVRAKNGLPQIAVVPTGPTGTSFTLCRAAGEYLASGGKSYDLVTGASTYRQKINRAFAAEFLAPARALHRRITDELVDEEKIEELAAEFGVSTFVIRHQVTNHNLAIVHEESVQRFS